jgi:hypothetical protein
MAARVVAVDVPAFERDMAARQRRHADGDRGAVLEALYFCFSFDQPVPDWASRAFCQAYGDVAGARVKSLHDVFGKPRGHIKRRRRLKDLEFFAWHRVCKLHRGGHPIDNEIFAMVAKELAMGARQVREAYYEIERAVQPES